MLAIAAMFNNKVTAMAERDSLTLTRKKQKQKHCYMYYPKKIICIP